MLSACAFPAFVCLSVYSSSVVGSISAQKIWLGVYNHEHVHFKIHSACITLVEWMQHVDGAATAYRALCAK